MNTDNNDNNKLTIAHLITPNSNVYQFRSLLLSATTTGWERDDEKIDSPNLTHLVSYMTNEKYEIIYYDNKDGDDYDHEVRAPHRSNEQIFVDFSGFMYQSYNGMHLDSNNGNEDYCIDNSIDLFNIMYNNDGTINETSVIGRIAGLYDSDEYRELIEGETKLRKKFVKTMLYFYPDKYEELLKSGELGVKLSDRVDKDFELIIAMDRFETIKSEDNVRQLIKAIFDHIDRLKQIFNNVHFRFIIPKINQKTGTMKNVIMQNTKTDFLYITDEDDIMANYTYIMEKLDTINFDKDETMFIHFNYNDDYCVPIPIWNDILYMPNIRKYNYNQGFGLVDGEDRVPGTVYGISDATEKRTSGYPIVTYAPPNAVHIVKPSIDIYSWRGSSSHTKRNKDPEKQYLSDRVNYVFNTVSRFMCNSTNTPYAKYLDKSFYTRDIYEHFDHRADLPVIFYVTEDLNEIEVAIFNPEKLDFERNVFCCFETELKTRKIKIEKDSTNKKFLVVLKDKKAPVEDEKATEKLEVRLNEDLRHLTKESEKYENRLNTFINKQNDFIKAVKEHESVENEMSEAISILNELNSKLTALHPWSKEYDELRSEIEYYEQLIQELQYQLDEIEEKYGDAIIDLRERMERMEELKNRRIKLEDEYDDIKCRMRYVNKELEALHDTIPNPIKCNAMINKINNSKPIDVDEFRDTVLKYSPMYKFFGGSVKNKLLSFILLISIIVLIIYFVTKMYNQHFSTINHHSRYISPITHN